MQRAPFLASFFILTTTMAASALAATVNTLAMFNNTNGANPYGGLIADTSGNLYGTTTVGGSSGKGTVFKLDASNSYAVSTLATFNGTNGSDADATLIADASGNLYGTTFDGGTNNKSTVFRVAAGSNALTTLATFNGTNGFNCSAPLIADASGNLYGTTQSGGSSSDGTVFRLDASNSFALMTLATFNNTNGANPHAGLIADASGNLYGTTFQGGSSNKGTVFKLDASNNYEVIKLATFNGTNGANPLAGLIADARGNLYGTTKFGGSSDDGTVFRLDASNNYALSTLVTFNFANGANPFFGSLLADASGNLYGTTAGGGLGDPEAGGYGTVFDLTNTGFVVPEPSSLLIVACAAVFTKRRRRR